MTDLSRRKAILAGAAGAIALGPLGRPLSASAQTPKPADRMLFIDALGGVAVNEEGLVAIPKSGMSMIDTTLGAPGNPPFSYEQAVADLAMWHGIFDRHGDRLIHVKSSSDILAARDSGRLGVMLGFQNGTHLDRKLDNVEFFYNLGIRMMLLTYNELNDLGAGCTERHDTGLSHFGVDVVKKMNQLGMIVDLAHCGKRTSLDAIAQSEKPVLFSHNNCRALNDNPRCKDDEQIRALAQKGGVMGIATVNFFVSSKPRSTLDDYIAHIDHVVQLVGIDHVAFGSDAPLTRWRSYYPTEKAFHDFHKQFNFKAGVDLRWPPFIEEIDVPEKMFIIKDALAKRGYKEADLRKIMGENLLRVYRQVIG
ncbi:dipeptidase [Sphingosinicella rhizophila]|uniref:Membrane dipeptidase n=2 Tax=Sphingosinicella rhizophila TaxID=3050082 RepID=A0ABU3QBN8_9SPHN|nr:membrane dipeptidase [Sphingosinicella sp. GR2756]MDT9600813.1 membrane dipeptidase [Sphingosinicella sp. GR2756]